MKASNDKKKIELSVPPESKGQRLDVFLASQNTGCSRSRVQQLIRQEYVTVNGKPRKASYALKGIENVVVVIPEPGEPGVYPEQIPLDILFEDEHVLVVNKPAGMVVHPACGNYSGTLVNALLFHCKDLSGVGGVLRPGIVHRLDKDTSGLLMVAKDDQTHLSLSKQLQERRVFRLYQAFVWGVVAESTGTIQAPVGRSPSDRKKMSVTWQHRRPAITHFTVVDRFDFISQLSLKLETGRTHQIRVHLSHIGHPVFGDPQYGGRNKRLKSLSPRFRPLAQSMLGVISRQALHAARLGFIHPQTGKYLEFCAEMPEDMKKLKEMLREEK